jgi:uncharacterized protein YicC (UPF0701 family)
MGIGLAMKELAQDIASSHKDRAKRIGEIKQEAKQASTETQRLIGNFQSSRKQTGDQLREDLAQDAAQRKSDVKRVLGNAQGMLKGFQASRRKASAQMRRELGRQMTELRSDVKDICVDAQQTIKGFRSDRKESGSELRRGLAESRASSKSMVGELLQSADHLIKDFQRAHRENGNKLRKELAQSKANRESEVEKMRREFGRAQAEVRGELKEARAAWQGLATTKRATVKLPRMKTPAVEEISDLEAKLLAAINKHPKGITLTKVAHSLGVAHIVLARASRALLEKGKIRKKGKLYLPAASK